MYKRKFENGHSKKKTKQRHALLACANDKNQKKLFFPTAPAVQGKNLK